MLSTLQDVKRALSAYALLHRLRAVNFLAPTQVHRALERLSQHGLVHRLESLNAYVSCVHQPLGFTRLAGGNVALGTALVPVNMQLQLQLYPLHLQRFANNALQLDAAAIGASLLQWFLLPLAIALITNYGLRWVIGQILFTRVAAPSPGCFSPFSSSLS